VVENLLVFDHAGFFFRPLFKFDAEILAIGKGKNWSQGSKQQE